MRNGYCGMCGKEKGATRLIQEDQEGYNDMQGQLTKARPAVAPVGEPPERSQSGEMALPAHRARNRQSINRRWYPDSVYE